MVTSDYRVRNSDCSTYLLNRDHVLAPVVEAAAGAAGTVEARITASVQGWTLPAAAVVLFGSFARRDGHDTSDVDLLLVRPDEETGKNRGRNVCSNTCSRPLLFELQARAATSTRADLGVPACGTEAAG
jgi:hypothetical protein